MRKFKRNFKKYICLSLCMALIITTVFVGTAATADNINYYRSAKVWKGGDNGDTISVSDYQLLDKNGNASSSCPSLADIINSISNGMAAGEVRAKKTVFFESPADAKKGYLKTNIDLVGNPSATTTDPMDILFVVDTSGSMNMFSTEPNYKSSVSPCLNEEHYYMIPANWTGGYNSASFTNNSNRNLYFRMKDLCPNGVTACSDIEITTLNKYLQETYDLSNQPITASGGDQTKNFWGAFNSEFSHHYIPTTETGGEILEDQEICFKEENGSIRRTYSNMRRSTLYDSWKASHTGYGSPDFNNDDGCFDRMMVTRQLLKSFSQDVLATNKNGAEGTNNRVAMLDFGGFDGLGIGKPDQYSYAYVGMGVKGDFAISNFVDFTDDKNDTELANALKNTKGYYGTDYQAALKSAQQVLLPEKDIDDTWTEYNNYKKLIDNNGTIDKGYIWSGSFPQSMDDTQNKRVYDWESKKYTGNMNLKKS